MLNLAQTPAAVNTELVGFAAGQYDAYRNGQHIGTVYGRTYAEALSSFHTLLDETRSAPASADWYSCPDCGKSNDVGQTCTICGHTPAAVETAADPLPAPANAVEQAATDLLALVATQRLAASTRGMLESRLEKAVALAAAGEVEFPQYGTTKTDHGYHGTRRCGCADATYRGLHVSPVGLACKHTLAQYLAEQVQAEAARVADRVRIDLIERQPRHDLPTIHPEQAEEIKRDIDRETALPASVNQRGSIEDTLGYDAAPKSLDQQWRDSKKANRPAACRENMTRSRWQV